MKTHGRHSRFLAGKTSAMVAISLLSQFSNIPRNPEFSLKIMDFILLVPNTLLFTNNISVEKLGLIIESFPRGGPVNH